MRSPAFALAAAAAAMIPLATFAPKAMAPLFAVTALAALAAHAVRTRTLPPVPVRLGLALSAFAAFAALSATWSIAMLSSLYAVVPVATMLFGGVVLLGIAAHLDESGRAAVRAATIGGGAVGLAFIGVEWAFGRPALVAYHSALGHAPNIGVMMSLLKPTSSIFALFAWPLLLALRQRYSRRVAFSAGGVLLALFVALEATAPVLAFALGGGVFLLARRFARMTAPLLGALLAVGVLAAPWIPERLPNPEWESRKVGFVTNSMIHRIQIWQTTARHIHAKPWLGYGFDTARYLYPLGTSVQKTFRRDDPAKTYLNPFEPIPLHPHNMILQIWLELGLVGAVLALAALELVIVSLSRAALDPTERAAGYACFVTALTIGCVSFGAWQAWWLSTVFLGSGLMISVFSRPPVSNRDPRRPFSGRDSSSKT